MSDVKPVLFSGPMIRALLDGRKTQTRRILKPQPPKGEYGDDYITRLNGPEWYEPAVVGKDGEIVPGKPIWGVYDDFGDFGARVPYMPGDLLWVRETWAIDEAVRSRGRYGRPDVYYLADRRPDVPSPDGFLTSAQLINMHLDSLRKRPAIHMPRWASRLTLEVTAVKVERLVEITEEDALAEGFTFHALASGDIPAGAHPIHSFRKLWDSLNAKRGYGWEDNPYVTVVQFSVFKLNVDAFLAQRKAA